MSNILLCVDDSVTMQTVAEITFKSSDWDYLGARTADEARSRNGKTPKIVLVDSTLPDASGYDLAKELKASNPSALVLMLCGNSSAYNEAKGSASGCDGHIVKPWQTDKIVAQISEMLASGGTAKTPTAPIKPLAAKTPPPPTAPRSATLMGIPALETPMPSKPLPAGVSALRTGAQKLGAKPAIPVLKTPGPVLKTPGPVLKTPGPVLKTPAPVLKTPAPVLKTPVARASAASKPSIAVPRTPMIKKIPGKPIRLVLASQAKSHAHSTAVNAGMSSEQASALGDVSRQLLEQIIWEVVPELAEVIIRENLDTLTAKSR